MYTPIMAARIALITCVAWQEGAENLEEVGQHLEREAATAGGNLNDKKEYGNSLT